MDKREQMTHLLFNDFRSVAIYWCSRTVLGLMRRIGLHPVLPFLVPIRITYAGKEATFYIKNQLDFDLLCDTFVTEEYKVNAISNPKTIFDLGGNIGATVIFFKLLYPDAHVYVFEPDPQNLLSLKKNCQQFGDSITIIAKAVIAKPRSHITFYQGDTHHWSSSTIARPEATKAVTVAATTLEQAIHEYDVTHVDVCKFDIEGGEYEVFQTMPGKSRIMWLIGELHPSLFHHSKQEFLALLPEFELVEERPGEVVVLKNRELNT